MNLGIKGQVAIVTGSSKGIGRACAIALANEGVAVTINCHCFLCSDLSDYITGATIYIDGGMMLYPSFQHGG